MDVLDDYARELGVPLRAGELARETFTELRDAGHGGHDFSVLVASHAAEAGVPLPIDLEQPLTAPPLLRLTGITKRFPGVVALDGVDLTLHAGVVHALTGENGSGKSTLARIASGALAPDAGRIEVDGVERTIGSPKEALDLGIVTISQELTLAPTLSVAENIFIGRLPRGRMRRIDWPKLRADARAVLDSLDVRVDERRAVGELSVELQQEVEIARAVSSPSRLLILDEATSSLSEAATQRLLEVVERLRSRGVAVLMISHRLPELYRAAEHGDRAARRAPRRRRAAAGHAGERAGAPDGRA